MRFDLLIKGGEVIDPGGGLAGALDVGISRGRIAAVAPDLPAEASAEVIDAAGRIVTPGLVDFHTHVFRGTTFWAVDADAYASCNRTCELGMSRATLARRLKREGTTFEAVLEGLRRRLAEDYLGKRRLSVAETSYLLGFSEPAAFSRAYRRWTGRSPRTARAAAQAEAQ